MKKFIVAAITASLIGTPVLAAPNQGHAPDNRGRMEQNDRRPDVRRHAARPAPKQTFHRADWKRGDRFDSRRAVNYRVIKNPRIYRLGNPPRGHRWVQSGRNAVLVRISNNIVASVVKNVIR